MDDLISKEIEGNGRYIFENGRIKFYQKSKYLSKVWKIYKKKYNDVSGMIEKYNLFSFPKDEIAIRSFTFIIDSLKNNFEQYYIDQKIIVKPKKIELENGESIVIKSISFGEKTKQYNLIENRVNSLIDNSFELLDYLMMLSDYSQTKYLKTNKKLKSYQGKKLLPEVKKAYIDIIGLELDGVKIPEACGRVNKRPYIIDKIKPKNFYKWRTDHSTEYQTIRALFKEGKSETEILDYSII